ncbi:universal stress protein [Halorubrum sp. CBA1125]|uniref:universal stress protein n=1 Tax=Halorubrum sp. CBA1125 TaxID=2668072 RepID=UPI0012E85594|nr:universal stress protein [Halorubrum sp. CBA1125]MUW13375.1 universal stress protein [Halorubrum sp. CBA1125]
METLERILVAIGPNDREYVDEFLDVVEPIAGPSEATVFLLHVFSQDEYEGLIEQLDADLAASEIDPDALATRHDDLRTPAARLDEVGVDTEIRGSIGEPQTEIIRIAEEIDADLLFIGGSGRSPAGKAVFGDSAQRILLNAPCPVTYIRRD